VRAAAQHALYGGGRFSDSADFERPLDRFGGGHTVEQPIEAADNRPQTPYQPCLSDLSSKWRIAIPSLNRVLAGAISLTDPVWSEQEAEMVEEGHGTALDRTRAYQQGFVDGTASCAAIDLTSI
jgi:hypothetical protein